MKTKNIYLPRVSCSDGALKVYSEKKGKNKSLEIILYTFIQHACKCFFPFCPFVNF